METFKMPRDPKRIPGILKQIEEIWTKHPDLRLGQLIGNAISSNLQHNLEDQELVDKIKSFYKDIISIKGKANEHDDCIECGNEEDGEFIVCLKSQRKCLHHCNHSWSHDICCWCKKTF